MSYQGVRNVCFSENLACFVLLKHLFWDSPFCFIIDDVTNNELLDTWMQPSNSISSLLWTFCVTFFIIEHLIHQSHQWNVQVDLCLYSFHLMLSFKKHLRKEWFLARPNQLNINIFTKRRRKYNVRENEDKKWKWKYVCKTTR